jgi:predicted ATPase
VREQYAHGAWLVELAPIHDAARIPAAVGSALGIRERPESSTLETLWSVLHRCQLLLVLDNCEHVVEAAAELANGLLQSCPDLCILGTSRQPLGLAGESVYQVPPLSLPRMSDCAEQLGASESVKLFVDRVQVADADFRLTPETTVVAARICHLLEGLPLGIELAAAREGTMQLSEIEQRLGQPLSLLTLGPRSAPARQQTLRAAIEWSYRLLAPTEQVLLRRVAVFTGGWTDAAATAVCADADLPAHRMPDLLHRLVAQLPAHCRQASGLDALPCAGDHPSVRPGVAFLWPGVAWSGLPVAWSGLPARRPGACRHVRGARL